VVKVHPQLSHNGHPVDGALVGASSLWPRLPVIVLNAFSTKVLLQFVFSSVCPLAHFFHLDIFSHGLKPMFWAVFLKIKKISP
jgi:hypothetical protein